MSKRTAKTLSPSEKALADEGWDEIGSSIASAVVHGGKSRAWAWEMIKPLGIYPKWMFDYWIKRCQESAPEQKKRKVGRPRTITKKSEKSVFKTREQMGEALRLVNTGIDASEIISRYTDKNNEDQA